METHRDKLLGVSGLMAACLVVWTTAAPRHSTRAADAVGAGIVFCREDKPACSPDPACTQKFDICYMDGTAYNEGYCQVADTESCTSIECGALFAPVTFCGWVV